jgi:hypothetical protein
VDTTKARARASAPAPSEPVFLPAPPQNAASAPAVADHSRDGIDRALDSLKPASIAFNTPDQMKVNKPVEIELLLSLERSVAELQGAIAPPGRTEGATVRVSRIMEARLTGPQFQITAITPEEQPVGSHDTVQWKWDVKPQSSGSQYLHLTLTAVLEVDGAKTRKAVRTFDKQIEVRVDAVGSAEDFIAKNWQWLCGTVFIPLGIWLWKRRRDGKAASQPGG